MLEVGKCFGIDVGCVRLWLERQEVVRGVLVVLVCRRHVCVIVVVVLGVVWCVILLVVVVVVRVEIVELVAPVLCGSVESSLDVVWHWLGRETREAESAKSPRDKRKRPPAS